MNHIHYYTLNQITHVHAIVTYNHSTHHNCTGRMNERARWEAGDTTSQSPLYRKPVPLLCPPQPHRPHLRPRSRSHPPPPHASLPSPSHLYADQASAVRPSVQRPSRFISSFRGERFLARPRVFPERIGRQIDAGAGVTFGSETARRSPGPRAPNLKLRAEGRSAKGWEKFVCSVAAGGKKSGGGNLSFCRRHLRKHSRTRYPPPRSAEDDGRRRRNEPT